VAAEDAGFDAAVFSGANIRSMESIEIFEDILDVPAVTSNQAVMWECLRTMGLPTVQPGLGRLFA
jgi:maleate cis-trans isomerase